MSVSNFHASVEKTKNLEYLLKDLNSTNGTFVDGRQVVSETIITKDSKP